MNNEIRDQQFRYSLMSDRIAQRANDLNISQADIARKLNASRSTVNSWFNGGQPSAKYMPELRRMLKVSQDWLDGTTRNIAAKNQDEVYSALDHVADIKNGQRPKTNAVRIPLVSNIDSNCNEIIFPTLLIKDFENIENLLFYYGEDTNCYIIDRSQRMIGLNPKKYLLHCSDMNIKYFIGEVKAVIGGALKVNYDGEFNDLPDNIDIIGKCLLTIEKI